jgi:hypothetical protein
MLFCHSRRFLHGDFFFLGVITFVCTDEQHDIRITFFFCLDYPVIFKCLERLRIGWIVHQAHSICVLEVLVCHCSVQLLAGSVPDLHSNFVRYTTKIHDLNFSRKSASSCCFAVRSKGIFIVSGHDARLSRALLANHDNFIAWVLFFSLHYF